MNLLVAIATGVGIATSAATQARGDDPVRVAVLYRDQTSHREAVSSFETALGRQGYTCVLIELPKTSDAVAQQRALQQLVDARPTVVASGGTKATLLALQTLIDIPVVFFMVPNSLDASFMTEGNPYRRRVGGVTTDVSPEDQLDWILRLAPHVRTIGVPYSERSARTVARIESAAAGRGITVRSIAATKDKFAEAIEKLKSEGCDGTDDTGCSRV